MLDAGAVVSVLSACELSSAEGFLQRLTEQLADCLDADLVFVCRAMDYPIGRVSVLASSQQPFLGEFDLPGSPCARVYDSVPMYIAEGVQHAFPAARGYGHESFAGFPFLDEQGVCKGHLAVFFKQPSHFGEEFKAHFALIARRAEAEFVRLALEQRLDMALRREQMHNRILQLATSHVPLAEVLDSLLRSVEAERPQLKCSILLLDASGKRLRNGAGPSLPEAYCRAVDGVAIGDGIGSCGTAAATAQRVVVADIQQHPYWAAFRALAAEHGLASCWSEPVLDAEGKVLGTFAIYQDHPAEPLAEDIELIEAIAHLVSLVLQHYRAREELGRRTRRYEQLLETAGDGVVVLNPDGCVLEANRAFLQLLGVSREEIVRLHPWDWDVTLTESDMRGLWQSLGPEPVVFETVVRHRQLGLRHAEVSTAMVSIDGEAMIWAAARDITERKQLEADLRRQATTDALTGVANRRQFLELLGVEFQRATRHHHPLALLMLDLDHFKQVNDVHGHAMGDEVLIAFCRTLQPLLRREDCLGRLGGEEFAILLPETDKAGALEAAERFRAAVAASVVERQLEGMVHRVDVTTSIGVAVLAPGEARSEGLLARADRALYQAKAAGRNRVELGRV